MKTMFVGLFAIDSWHLVGGHFPSVDMSAIYENLDDVLDYLMNIIQAYKPETANHTPITRGMLEEEIKNAKYHNARIKFEYPREGEIQIQFN